MGRVWKGRGLGGDRAIYFVCVCVRERESEREKTNDDIKLS